MLGIQKTQAHPQGLVTKAVAARKLRHAAGCRIDGIGRQRQIEQFGQHAALRFDELAVHARQIDLAQIEARAWMRLQPGHQIEQLRPDLGQRQRAQGLALQPRQERRLTLARGGQQGLEHPRLTCLADDLQRVVERVDPGLPRQAVLADDAVPHLAQHQPVARARALLQIGHPAAHRVETLGQVARRRHPQRQSQREKIRRCDPFGQQLALVPASQHLGAQVGGRAPVAHGANAVNASRCAR